MRNDNLKLLDKHEIKDGLLRESIIQNNYKEAVKDIDIAIEKRFQQTYILEQLKEKLQNEMRNESVSE